MGSKGKDSQSNAFFIIPLNVPLYSGVLIKIPEDFLTNYLKSITALGISNLIHDLLPYLTKSEFIKGRILRSGVWK